MDIKFITDFLNNSPIIKSMVVLVVTAIFLAIQATFFMECTKIVYEKTFTEGKRLDSRISFFVNLIFIFITSISFSLLDDSSIIKNFKLTPSSIISSLSYFFQILVYTWVLSILLYTFIVKLLFSGIYILTDKVGIIQDTVKSQRLLAKVDLEKTILLNRATLEQSVLEKIRDNVENLELVAG